MTVRGYPFDTTGEAGSVTELEWRRLMRWIAPSGVLRGEDNQFAVTQRAAGAAMSVDVATGQAFIVGHYVRSDAVESVAVGNNLTGNPRIDTIVVGFDFVANAASVYCLPGVPAVAPAAAALTQDLTTVWEEALAYLAVAAGEFTSIDTAEITDCRHYAAPLAHHLLPVVRLATTAPLAASTVTGVDRVANANGAIGNIDGVAVAVGDGVLDKDHATGALRGLWRLVDLGSASKPWRMRRSYIADDSAKVRAGMSVRVTEGTVSHDSVWLLTTDDPIVLGTTALTFTRQAGSFIGAKVFNSAGQTLVNNTAAVITFDTELQDTHGFHSTSVNTSRMTIPAGFVQSGLTASVRLTGQIDFNANATGYREIRVYKNGATLAFANQLSIGAGAGTVIQVEVIDPAAVAGDYYELVGYQNSGGALDITQANAGIATWFQFQYLG